MAWSPLCICFRSPEPLFVLGPATTSLLQHAVTYCQARLSAWPITEARRQADDCSVIAHHSEQDVTLLNCSRVPSINLLICLWLFQSQNLITSNNVCRLCLESCYTHFLLALLHDRVSWKFSFFSKRNRTITNIKKKAEPPIFELADE